MKTIFLFLLQIYRKGISPLFGKKCRFYPSCSEYAMHAMQTSGFFFGLFMIVKRLFKCHPFHAGGLDPYPTKEKLHG